MLQANSFKRRHETATPFHDKTIILEQNSCQTHASSGKSLSLLA